MKYITLMLVGAMGLAAAEKSVDIYTPSEIKNIGSTAIPKGASFGSKELKRYGNHYTMVASREATGSAEVHNSEADFFVVENGTATLVTGGKVVGPHTEKPGEIRGTSIEGGERHHLSSGDIVHIPAGVPHELLIDKGTPFTYFVVKVTGQ